MSARRLTLQALDGLPLIAPGDDLAALLAGALRRDADRAARTATSSSSRRRSSRRRKAASSISTRIEPSPRAVALAQEVGKDARLVEVILRESTEVVRHKKDVLIVAHRLGFVMANAGVDQSERRT